MPTQGTQAYWHELPQKKPPWRDAAALRACIQESKQNAAADGQAMWDGKPSMKRPRLMPEHERFRMERIRERRAAVKQLECPKVHRGVVPEPNATPLRVINVVMAHLGQPLVSYAEAERAVDGVVMHYNTLTQPSQSQTDHRDANSAADLQGSRSRRPSRRKDPVTLAMASALSQSQRTDVLGSTQPTSSQPTRPPTRGGAALALGVQSSLLLDVVAELCRPRSLHFKRLSRADLGGMKWRITSVEAVPHRRVVLLADRRDPYFVVLCGVERGVKPEPFVVATLKEENVDPYSLKRYRTTETPYTQVLCAAPAPVPWRRVWRNLSISTFRNEFVAAVIELDEDAAADVSNNTATTTTTDGAATSTNGDAARDAQPRSVLSDVRESVHRAPPVQPARRAVTLLGASEDDDDEEGDLVFPHFSMSRRPPRSIHRTPEEERERVESEWIRSEAMFNEERLPEAQFEGGAVGGGAEEQLDPLQRLPRTEAQDRLSNAKLRVWYRRLLSDTLTAGLMARLHRVDHDEH